MHHSVYTPANLTTFTHLERLGLTAIGQRFTPKKAEILCHVSNPDPWCQACGEAGVVRDTVTRGVTHAPFDWPSTVLRIRHRRYRCAHCQRVRREDLSQAVAPRQKISHTTPH